MMPDYPSSNMQFYRALWPHRGRISREYDVVCEVHGLIATKVRWKGLPMVQYRHRKAGCDRRRALYVSPRRRGFRL